ncbi:MAG: histidine phosphatase family protein [Parcubacteria group bacterium]|nr:histidine phosphatase family protein [Parcubacteria group bacterium]
MTLPINFVVVRHAESESNAAKRRSRKGDHDAANKLRGRHTASFRLTGRGKGQARTTGGWLQQEFYGDEAPRWKGWGFDRCYASDYLRAMETGGLFALPGAKWLCDMYLTERDWGDIHALPEDERLARFGEALRMKEQEPFFWRPPNGQSLADKCLQVDRFLDTLHRECSDMNVLATCHGETAWAIRVRIEKMSQQRFRALHLSKNPDDKIKNCQVLHYTRRNPFTGELTPRANWLRMVRPAENPVWDTGWQEIERPTYSNDDLLQIVEAVPPDVT